jgi:hypothetical protein
MVGEMFHVPSINGPGSRVGMMSVRLAKRGSFLGRSRRAETIIRFCCLHT